MTLKQKLFCEAYLDRQADTYSNATKSAQTAYTTKNANSAHMIGSDNLHKPTIQNYLERRAEELGIGVQVRLKTYGDIAGGATPRTTTTRVYGRAKSGDMVLMRRIVSDAPVKDADRIKALQAIDNITGLKEQREIDKEYAMREYEDLYRRIVGHRVRNVSDSSNQSSDMASSIDGSVETTLTSIESDTVATSESKVSTSAQNDTVEVDYEHVSKSVHQEAQVRAPGERSPAPSILSSSLPSLTPKKNSSVGGSEKISGKKNGEVELLFDSKDIIKALLKEIVK